MDEKGREMLSIKRVVSMSPFGCVFDQHKSVFVEKGGARGQV